MIKLKELANNQVQPDEKNPFEPAKAPAQTQAAPANKPAPVQQTTKQPVKPSVPKVAPAQKPVAGNEADIKNKIFNIKMRLNQLALPSVINKFQITLKAFKSNVNRNISDKSTIQTYLSPLIGDLESLKGNIESLEVELKKLDNMTKVEEK